MSIGLISFELIQTIRLNEFVHLYIQRDGITAVVENYQPIRRQYYDAKYPNEKQQSPRKDDQDV